MVAYDNTSGCAGIWLLGGNVALANVTVLCGDGELNGITGRVDGLPRSIGPDDTACTSLLSTLVEFLF